MNKRIVIKDIDGKKLDSVKINDSDDVKKALKRWKLKGFF